MKDYFIVIEISIQNGILTPENFQEAINKIPVEFITKDLEPTIQSLENKKATLIFKCMPKIKGERNKPLIEERKHARY